MADRDSEPDGPELTPVVPEKERARREVENGFRQFDLLADLIRQGCQGYFTLKPWMLMKLNREAVEGLRPDAGRYRLSGMKIKHSKLEPPAHGDVPQHVDELCEYINLNWEKSAFHLAAYVMWRLNWIHPFSDGNGRTSRAASYLVLCVRLGGELPGDQTIPAQIERNKAPYYKALERADATCGTGNPDLEPMEELLKELLHNQILNAGNKTWNTTPNRKSLPRRGGISVPGGIRSPSEVPSRTWAAEHKVAIMVAVLGAVGAIAAAMVTAKCASRSEQTSTSLHTGSPDTAPGPSST